MKDSLPPCSIDDVIVHHFNFEGLKKYIEYMDGNTWKALNQISEIKLKLLEIDEIKTSLSEVFARLDNFTSKFNDLENTVSFQQMKIMDVEKKAQSHDDKIANVETSCSEAMKSVQMLEDNVHNLNRVTEDNCKSIDKLALYHENIRKATEAHSVKLETHEKNLSLINSEITKVAGIESTLSQHMIKTKQKIHKLKKRDNDQDNLMKTKFQEIDLNIIKLFSSVSDLSGNILPNQPETMVPKTMIGTSKKKEEDSYSGSNSKFNIDSFYKEYSDFRFKIEDEVKSLSNKIKLNNKSSNNLARQLAAENDNLQHSNNMNISPDVVRTDMNSSSNNLNQQYIISSINQLQENDKLVLQNLSYKVNREELEKLQRHMGQEIERSMVKVTETITKNDEKNKKLAETVITQNVDRTEIKKIIQDVGKEIFSDEIGKILFEHLEKNEGLKNLFAKTDTNAEEIQKLYESVLEIRRITIDEKAAVPITEKEKKDMIIRLSDLELHLKHLRNQFDENIKGLETNDNADENEKDTQPASIRDYIRHVAGNLKVLGEKFEKMQAKQENMNSEILGKVRKDLGTESNRLLDEFRNDLKNSIGKIEDQLREKVDRMNLDEFGRKFDHKLVNEISKKIDKTDLKKNNTYLNKKIDHLENKISKTLVDTLIDLQMEEAPLIVKKSIMGDKCGSCNQVILNQTNNGNFGYNIHMHNNSSANFGMNYNNQPTMEDNNTSRYKLRTIQDNSNKYGTGSYSRILSNVSPDVLNEELRPGMKNNMNSTSVQLPGIRNGSLDKRRANDVTPPRFRNKAPESRNNNNNMTMSNMNNNSTIFGNNLAVTHDSEKIMSSVINEELEKKYINPENLIKASNKFAEGNMNNNQKLLK